MWLCGGRISLVQLDRGMSQKSALCILGIGTTASRTWLVLSHASERSCRAGNPIKDALVLVEISSYTLERTCPRLLRKPKITCSFTFHFLISFNHFQTQPHQTPTRSPASSPASPDPYTAANTACQNTSNSSATSPHPPPPRSHGS